jgi:hypothetical protein
VQDLTALSPSPTGEPFQQDRWPERCVSVENTFGMTGRS